MPPRISATMRPLLLCLALCAACHHPDPGAKKEQGPAIPAAPVPVKVAPPVQPPAIPGGEAMTTQDLALVLLYSGRLQQAQRDYEAAVKPTSDAFAAILARYSLDPKADKLDLTTGQITRAPKPAKDAGAK